MINFVAGIVFDEGDVPLLLWTFFSFYVLFYGPWVLIPLGLVLVGRLFVVKKRTKKATIVAVSVLAAGILLAITTLILHSMGSL